MTRSWLLLLAAAFVATASPARADVDPAVLKAEAERVAVMDKAEDAVLAIFSSSGRGGGSGVVISADGYALTNFHVVKPCGNAMKCGMADGSLYDAVVVGIDPTGDVALIKLFGRDDFPHAELGDSDQLETGDWCFAMGNPFLLATNFQPTATYGIVSGTHRYQYPAGTLLEYTDCIQTDASINPGNSGGPLFNAAGQLIGINGRGSFEKRGRVNVGVAYAISINQIKNFLGYLHSGRIVDHATLGAVVGFDQDQRVVVVDILEDGDAFRRGLRYGDEIVAFGGRPIATPNAFKNVLGIYPKGWRVPLSFRRDGVRYDVLVRLSGVHAGDELIKKTAGRPPVPIRVPSPDKDDSKEKKDSDPDKEKDAKPHDDGQPGEAPKQIKRIIEGAKKLVPGGDKPKAPGRDKQPQDQPQPIPMPGDPHGARPIRLQAPMPDICKQHFEQRRGYANFHFNRLHRDRVLDAWRRQADLHEFDGPWVVSGEAAGTGQTTFELTGDTVLLKLPRREYSWTAGEELGASPDPPQSNGLMPALYLWRKLATVEADQFGDVSYIGTMPLPGHEGLVDAIRGLAGGVQCHFLFDREDGRLLAVEFFAADDMDPCEIYFSEYRDVDGRQLPGRMEVRTGEVAFATFTLEEYRFEKAAETPGDDND